MNTRFENPDIIRICTNPSALNLRHRLENVLGTQNSSYFKDGFYGYADGLLSLMCHSKPLPCNDKGECITRKDANHTLHIEQLEYG